MIGQFGKEIIGISKGYKNTNQAVMNSMGPVMPSPRGKSTTIVNQIETPRETE